MPRSRRRSDDAFPYDPAESLDSDGDGVGDRADLESFGGDPIDSQNPTPDSDGDGLFGFADNCVDDANPEQEDGDEDGFGDACDNCPVNYNPEQTDSIEDGTGDACRSCTQAADCPNNQICEAGSCIDCISNAQCGDRVCISGACVPCTSTEQCSGGELCNVDFGVCQECLISDEDVDGNARTVGAAPDIGCVETL